ncbi:restriction endonuclease subunit S [Helicobacter cetorum]|uniref:Type I restriction modification DNA specificity domain-containing protein n=1 Tax=Helicobacter cetorum (strain ATCC BAA-540 / CCUG 52418 / MIT 99-5656) TaxID=1163745 RepID=I0ERJ7_HELCM|nr:restriction endonuclease subunit S [Helicobacter cetorum]AFI05566.1 hypothetical protein HCD_02740 [Helicobacter cetorum MIT 99-5656]
MRSYIIKPKGVKKSDILAKECVLSSFLYRFVEYENLNVKRLGDDDILEKNVKGFEIGSKQYIDFSKNYFIRISEMNDLDFTFNVSNDTLKIRPVDKNYKNKTIEQGDICYQTASSIGNVCVYNGSKAFFNSHIRKISFKKNPFYIFAFLKSSFCKEQVDILGSIKGVDNFREDYLLNTLIPFPTTKNYKNPQVIEQLVANIVQNIIDKEEQIKRKNILIDTIIETELRENQQKNTFSYSYPTIKEIKQESRLDTGIYSRNFKENQGIIENYIFGYSNIFDLGYDVSRGQNLQISNIGESLYSNKVIHGAYKLILSKFFNERTYKRVVYLGNKEQLKTIEKGDIIFSCRGEMGRCVMFPELVENMITNIDNVHIVSKNRTMVEKIYCFCILGYLKNKNILDSIACIGSGAPSFTQYQFSKLKIPNFPKIKQQEIAKEYYNPMKKNMHTSLGDYLAKEQMRNAQIGIFELNNELFTLKEHLGDILHRIIADEEIILENYF